MRQLVIRGPLSPRRLVRQVWVYMPLSLGRLAVQLFLFVLLVLLEGGLLWGRARSFRRGGSCPGLLPLQLRSTSTTAESSLLAIRGTSSTPTCVVASTRTRTKRGHREEGRG